MVGKVNLLLTSSQASKFVEPDSIVHTDSSNLLSKADSDTDLGLSSVMENRLFYPFLQAPDDVRQKIYNTTNKFSLGSKQIHQNHGHTSKSWTL